MRKNYNSLPREEQIRKLKQENIIVIISGIVISVLVVVLIIYLLTQTDQIELAIGLCTALPVSIYIGIIFQVRDNNEKIKSLQIEMKDEETK